MRRQRDSVELWHHRFEKVVGSQHRNCLPAFRETRDPRGIFLVSVPGEYGDNIYASLSRRGPTRRDRSKPVHLCWSTENRSPANSRGAGDQQRLPTSPQYGKPDGREYQQELRPRLFPVVQLHGAKRTPWRSARLNCLCPNPSAPPPTSLKPTLPQ